MVMIEEVIRLLWLTTATAVTTSHSSLVMMMSQTDPPNTGFLS